MASEESMMINSSSFLDEENEDTDDGFHYQTRQSSLSRLSICTSSFHEDDEDNFTNHPSQLGNFISELSLESFDDDVGAEADGEISDDGEDSDSDKEPPGFYSLPMIMSRRRSEVTLNVDGSKCSLVKQKRVLRGKSKRGSQYGHGFNGVEGESDGDGNRYSGGGEGGLTVLTNAKGGKKSMMMGFEEVKACRDLGFDVEVPDRVSISAGSNRETQTSSGGNSPIANWRISSPGDDPKEVKARLKMWAQAVALASASR
ncbi:Uncharacterized protein Rs2_09921 [Raphanus sativus]|uniref:Uncharacterized protein LOC108846141 n=1 Tax=Raphanus sativus TaxID=3726 RepID=A0A6J0MQW2_RAPSA|nr:uncharacterized protein LOC108846141 [Raphanus sativus]KAJ4906263.1 Uncharacterized protein Rs2_09921 [Raphanus sativus]